MTVETTQSDPIAQQLREACAELSARLRAGETCRAEDYFSAHPELGPDPSHALALIQAEWQARRELGQQPTVEELLARFPQWKEQLLAQFSTVSEESRVGLSSTTSDTIDDVSSRRGADFPIQSLDHHDVKEPALGEGAMGVVYKAWDPILHRHVALKRMKSGVLAGPEEVERFYREARSAARLRHPNIVPIYGMGLYRGEHCFTMALLPGGGLDSRKKQYRDPRAAAALVEKIARAVQVAHDAGIIHRDLKPANILLDEQGEPLVADFGLAKLLEADVELTHLDDFAGTPLYMGPEQFPAGGGRATSQSDVWALGVILYELLAGQRPFSGQTWPEVAEQVRTVEPQPLRQLCPDLDPALEAVVLACLRKDVRTRYASAKDLADDLARWLRNEPPLPPPSRASRGILRGSTRAVILLGLAFLLTVSGAAVYFWPPGQEVRPDGEEDAPLEVKPDGKEDASLIFADADGKLTGDVEWLFGERDARDAALADDGTLSLRSSGVSALVLGRPPWQDYRLEADIHFTLDGNDSRVGLLFGLDTGAGPGTRHCSFLTVAYTEPLPGKNNIQLEFRPFLQEPQFRSLTSTLLADNRTGRSPLFDPDKKWGKLRVVVHGETCRCAWVEASGQESELRTLEPADLQSFLSVALREDGLSRRPFHPQQAVGVFLAQGKAAFRNIRLQSLHP